MPQTATFAESEADRMILEDKSYYRVADLQDFSGARSSYFHKTIGGYHAAKLTRYNDLITRQIQPAIGRALQKAHDNAERLSILQQDSTLTQAEADSIDTRLFAGVDEPILNLLNTKYYLYGDYAEENPNAYGNAWFVDRINYVDNANQEMEALSAINPHTTAVAGEQFKSILGEATPVSGADKITLTEYAPDKLTFEAVSATGGIAVFSDIYFPWGWEATVDGTPTPIGRVDYTFRALRLPAGKHQVIFEFNPKSLTITNTIGIIAVIAIFLLSLLALGVWIKHIKQNSK